MQKERLDAIVAKRFNVSRSKAQGLIQTNKIKDGNGQVLNKQGLRVDPAIVLELVDGPPFVSRGGEKLKQAFEQIHFGGLAETDFGVGESAGGFTDCLLQEGAAQVYAVDVGYGQLVWELRQNPKVIVLERCNIRNLTREQLDVLPSFFTIDCSFISLTMVLSAVMELMAPNPEGLALIKPQFEAGKEHVSRGGVVRDAAVHARVIESVSEFAKGLGFSAVEVIPSPLLGPAGNREFLAWMHGFKKED